MVKTPCLVTIQRMIEEKDGKRFVAANKKCVLNLQSPCHLTGQLVGAALFSPFLVGLCLPAGCELFASISFIGEINLSGLLQTTQQ